MTDAIYTWLDELNSQSVKLHVTCDLNKISDDLVLTFHHTKQEKSFKHSISTLILTTGYRRVVPELIKPLRPYEIREGDK